MKNENIKKITLIGLFAAIIAVISQIAIPLPSGVPVTLQTFIIALAGCILGAKYGAVATTVYVLLGAVGLPVFAGFKGGIGALFGYTGGFLIGFILMAVLCGLGENRNKVIGIILCVASIVVDHLCGVLWYTFLTKNTIWASVLQVSVPYLIKDIISVICAYFIAQLLKKRISLLNFQN